MTERIAEVESNIGILRYLADGGDPWDVIVEPPTANTDTWRLGAHPDVVEHLWTTLNAALPTDSRHLIAGGAVLVRSEDGAILAVALGTRYAIRLSGAGLAAALQRGHETTHDFRSVGRRLELTETFGAGWVFGQFDRDEADWLAESYAEAARA